MKHFSFWRNTLNFFEQKTFILSEEAFQANTKIISDLKLHVLLLLCGSSFSTSLAHSKAIGALSLGTGSKDHVDVSSVVDLSLLHFIVWKRTHLSTTHVRLSLLLLFNLGSLVLHLTGTSQRAMDLATSTETEDQMKSRFLLNIVIGERATILQLFAGEDQALLIWGNSLLILNLSLDVLNCVRGLHIERDGLS